jgi:hypothetical protein
MTDLVDREVWEFPSYFGVGITFLGKVPPDDNDRSSWFRHDVYFV